MHNWMQQISKHAVNGIKRKKKLIFIFEKKVEFFISFPKPDPNAL